ncbi:unnamed protein product, partial [Phaeothamnion confervicola]
MIFHPAAAESLVVAAGTGVLARFLLPWLLLCRHRRLPAQKSVARPCFVRGKPAVSLSLLPACPVNRTGRPRAKPPRCARPGRARVHGRNRAPRRHENHHARGTGLIGALRRAAPGAACGLPGPTQPLGGPHTDQPACVGNSRAKPPAWKTTAGAIASVLHAPLSAPTSVTWVQSVLQWFTLHGLQAWGAGNRLFRSLPESCYSLSIPFFSFGRINFFRSAAKSSNRIWIFLCLPRLCDMHWNNCANERELLCPIKKIVFSSSPSCLSQPASQSLHAGGTPPSVRPHIRAVPHENDQLWTIIQNWWAGRGRGRAGWRDGRENTDAPSVGVGRTARHCGMRALL